MAQFESDCGEQLIRTIDEALAENPALSPTQIEDVRLLRVQLQDLSRVGKLDDALRREQQALAIIRQGASQPE